MFIYSADEIIASGEAYIQRLKDAANMEKVITNDMKQAFFNDLGDVRRSFASEVTPHLGENRRHAEKAIYRHVSKSGLFASLDITSRRRASGERIPYRNGRKKVRPISPRTMKLQTYAGGDAAFILRWLQNGTDVRYSDYGNRGAISPRPFALEHHYTRFKQIGERYVEGIIENAKRIIDNGNI